MPALLNKARGSASLFVILVFLLITSLAFVVLRFKLISRVETRYNADLLRIVEALDAGKDYAIRFFPNPVKFEMDFFDLKVYSGRFELDFTNLPGSSLASIPIFSNEKFSAVPLVVEITAQRKERTGFARRAKVYYYGVLTGK